MLIYIQNEREWQEFCAKFLDDPDLPQREGFQTNVIRVANRAMVDAHIAVAFARLSRAQAAGKLRAANTAYGFVNDVAAFSRHPALRRTMVATPNGPVRLPHRRCCAATGHEPWGRCRRSANTRRNPQRIRRLTLPTCAARRWRLIGETDRRLAAGASGWPRPEPSPGRRVLREKPGRGVLIVAAQAWASGVAPTRPATRCSAGQPTFTCCWYSEPTAGVAE